MQNEILKTQKIGLKLSQVGTLSRMFAIQTFAAKGFIITPEQFTVLSVLIENDGLYQRQISAITLKDRPNITRILNILEKLNLISRVSDTNKRKIYKIFITEKGKKVYEEVLPVILDIWKATCEGIEINSLYSCIDVIEKIKQNLSKNTILQI